MWPIAKRLLSGKITQDSQGQACPLPEAKKPPEIKNKAKSIEIPISTIYYWIHQGHLDVTQEALLYPRKQKTPKNKASSNFKLARKSIKEHPENINWRQNLGNFEIDPVTKMRVY